MTLGAVFAPAYRGLLKRAGPPFRCRDECRLRFYRWPRFLRQRDGNEAVNSLKFLNRVVTHNRATGGVFRSLLSSASLRRCGYIRTGQIRQFVWQYASMVNGHC